MAEITLYELSSYNNGYPLQFTIELDNLSYTDYQNEVFDNLKRLEKECLNGQHGQFLQDLIAIDFTEFEEIIVSDYEDIPSQLVNEFGIDQRFFDLLESDIDIDVYEAYVNCFGIPDDIDNIDNLFIGQFNDKIDFINDHYLENTEELESIKLGETDALFYIDKERLADDILINLYSESNNYYFMQR